MGEMMAHAIGRREFARRTLGGAAALWLPAAVARPGAKVFDMGRSRPIPRPNVRTAVLVDGPSDGVSLGLVTHLGAVIVPCLASRFARGRDGLLFVGLRYVQDGTVRIVDGRERDVFRYAGVAGMEDAR